MGFQLPNDVEIPQYGSSLAALMPAYQQGRKARLNEDGAKAFAEWTRGQQPGSALQRLATAMPQTAVGTASPSFFEQLVAPFSRQQPARTQTAVVDAAAPSTPASRAIDAATRPINGMVSDTSNIPAGYLANARAVESGGNDQAANPNSSALGRFQFLDSTWTGLSQKYPELGLTADGRTDPAQQERAMARFTQDNAVALSKAGIPVSPGSLYAAHFLGAGGATKALSADPSTPMAALVDPGVIQANPQLQGMTAGEFSQWAQSKGGNASGGYQPPLRDNTPAVSLPPPEIMQAMFASEDTRPIAIALAQAHIDGQQLPEYTTFSGPDGSLIQMETRSGQMSVVQQGQKPQQPTDDMQEYNFYRDQETAAGRQPKPFGEWLHSSTKSGNGLSTQPSWGRDAQGNSVLGQIGADGVFHPTTMPDGVTAIDPAEMAGGRARSTVLGREGGGVQFDLPNAELTAQQTLAAIDKLRVLPDPDNPDAAVNPGADETFGNFGGIIPQQWFGSAPGTPKRDFEVAREQLQGKVFLQAFGMLKGGGQITEVEGLKAEQALAKLNTAQSREAFQEGLDEFRQAVQDGLAKLKQQAGTPYSSEPQMPAPAGQQQPQDLTGASDADLMRLLGI